MRDRLFALLLRLLPHHLLSSVMHAVARSQWPPLKRALIGQAIRSYDIDLSVAAEPDPEAYPSFNAFFTRALKATARPLATEAGAIVSPVDGAVSQAQAIQNGRLFQAKGQDYSLLELLGGDRESSAMFEEGLFATIYLSPRDYHRIHMPLTGRLLKMTHVPGRLFSVNDACARSVPRLFSRNERIVNLFATEAGPMAVIMVGAIFVSSMDTVWAGCVTPASQRVSEWRYDAGTPQEVTLERGQEMGRFNMGSTVILLFAKDAVNWVPNLLPRAQVTMGEKIGELAAASG
ncbi:MAG: phosphatidylserine decarboxylase [Gammaproteobacteria bacterium]|nr:phosphatidylserine decarboxylase [Gammaproteobacteria bacterium]